MPFTPPVITQFACEPCAVRRGESARLTWSTEGDVTDLNLSPGPPLRAGDSQLDIKPRETTTYEITAAGAAGTDSKSVTVEVVIRSDNTPQRQPNNEGTGAKGIPAAAGTDMRADAERAFSEAQSNLGAKGSRRRRCPSGGLRG